MFSKPVPNPNLILLLVYSMILNKYIIIWTYNKLIILFVFLYVDKNNDKRIKITLFFKTILNNEKFIKLSKKIPKTPDIYLLLIRYFEI